MAQEASDQEQLLEFVRTQVNTFVKWDVVTYFHHNPYAADVARNIARFAGREVAELAAELPALVEQGILEARSSGMDTIYCLTKDSGIRAQVASFVAACEDRDFRTRAIQTVIEGLERP